MEFNDYLDEFVADWQLTGHSSTTATTYRRYLAQLWTAHGDEIDLATVKLWLSESVSRETARARARAVSSVREMGYRQRWTRVGVVVPCAVGINETHPAANRHGGRLQGRERPLHARQRRACGRVVVEYRAACF